MQINANSNVPIYEQIYQQYIEYISNGILRPGDKLPSVRELSSQIHINPNTVVKAYRMLEDNKFIHSFPGKGSFVSEREEDQTLFVTEKILEECKQLIVKCKYIDMTYDTLCQILKTEWEK